MAQDNEQDADDDDDDDDMHERDAISPAGKVQLCCLATHARSTCTCVGHIFLGNCVQPLSMPFCSDINSW